MRPPRRPSDWPSPLPETAFIGLAGEIVRAIEPISEADPAALLVQLLTAFGNAVGRGPHFRAEADRHGLNLFTLIVGATAKGRKGTSWGHVAQLMTLANPEWSANGINNGLSSAEGLIAIVQDLSPDAQLSGSLGRLVPPSDKRKLIIESEFVSALNAMKKPGNNLSAVLRQAWDGGRLQTITKFTPLIATDSHISIVGHITQDELKAKLADVDTANGFLNRFLIVLSTRSQLLPNGGRLSDPDLSRFACAMRAAINKASKPHEFLRDAFADELWIEEYPALSEGHAGQFGGAVSRAEAQVMRLACVYAALDGSSFIGRLHLEAALALWSYVQDSAAHLFAGRFGDAIANRLYAQLKQSSEGMTSTELHRFLGNHASKEQLETALEALVDFGAARSVNEETRGRPATRWFAK